MKLDYRNAFILSFIVLVTAGTTACSKLLDEKPDRSITTVTSIRDLKAILNTSNILNNLGISLADVGGDEYTVTSSAYDQMSTELQNGYRWDANTELDAWSQHYAIIYYSNVVLQELDRLTDGSATDRATIKGQALFFRALCFYQLAQFYCKPYSETAKTDPGIPLRLTPNVEEKIFRSTISETYQRILKDLEEAATLLPEKFDNINHPGKLACWGLLARIHLSMRDYSNAEKFSKMYLDESPQLLNYNMLDTSANPGIPIDNIENNFLGACLAEIPSSNTTINPDLLNLYEENDLRRKIFFSTNHADNSTTFKGSYEAREGYSSYCGIATDEIYLIHAECLARQDRSDDALERLNTLLENRFKEGTFVPVSGISGTELIRLILEERRKELPFRGARWSDLRRLNLEGENIGLSREVNGSSYALPPNDKRWVWLIPQSVIQQSGIAQNER